MTNEEVAFGYMIDQNFTDEEKAKIKEKLVDQEKYKNLYLTNDKFKNYVDGYCKTYGFSVDIALMHQLVRETGDFYMSVQNDGYSDVKKVEDDTPDCKCC
jgi:hypothetical protein